MPRVLIIEDEAELREMIKTTLIRRKYTVMEASNGKEALLHFKPSMTDLVVTDLIMPEEDGLKVIIKLKELKPSLKIIAVSGGGKAGPGGYLNLAKALGAHTVISKPFSINDLIVKIEELLDKEQ
ncbi:MAG TPA: response regulator [Bacteroidales bacterium]|nr:response regulator [Bacteroidales bacterium]